MVLDRNARGIQSFPILTRTLLFSKDFEELAREALGTERDTVIALRNDESINDDVLRRIQRDIDLAQAPASKAKIGNRT